MSKFKVGDKVRTVKIDKVFSVLLKRNPSNKVSDTITHLFNFEKHFGIYMEKEYVITKARQINDEMAFVCTNKELALEIEFSEYFLEVIEKQREFDF